MSPRNKLAALQLAIMQVLWERGEATVADVREALSADRDLAHTTVATMLVKLEKKGHVAHRSVGRAFLYRPLLEPDQVKSSMLTDLVQQLFRGDVTQLMTHLLDESPVTREDLARLKALIAEKEAAHKAVPHNESEVRRGK